MEKATPLPLYAIGLGSNRRHGRYGDPRRVLLAALSRLESDDIEPIDTSPIIITAPLGPSRRRYANAAALVASPLAPPAMLARLKTIEAEFGRRIGQRWGARTLDLDSLLWSGGIWHDDVLQIPHVSLSARDFALAPLRAIAPDWRHPLNQLNMRQLFTRLIHPKPVDHSKKSH